MIGAKARTAQRRAAIDRLLAGGYGDSAILTAFGSGDLRELLSADEGKAQRTLRRDLSWCQAERLLDPGATAARDHLADLREQIHLAEEYLKEAKGSERRLQLAQLSGFRRDLAEAEGRGLMPPERRKPGPQSRTPEEGRPTGRVSYKAGQRVDSLKREPPDVDRSTREPQAQYEWVDHPEQPVPDNQAHGSGCGCHSEAARATKDCHNPLWDLTEGRYQQDAEEVTPDIGEKPEPTQPTKPKASKSAQTKQAGDRLRRSRGEGAVPPEYRGNV